MILTTLYYCCSNQILYSNYSLIASLLLPAGRSYLFPFTQWRRHAKNIMVRTRNSIKSAVADALGNNDILLGIAPYLDCRDLANLALTSRRFGSKQLGNEDWSLVDDVARQMIVKTQTAEERAAMPRNGRESWIALLHELKMLRSPLQFDQLVGDRIAYVEGNRARVTSWNPDLASQLNADLDSWTGTLNNAICSSQVMRAGKHYAKFRITGCDMCFYMFAGVMRPGNGLDNPVLGLNDAGPWDHDFHRSLCRVESDSSVDCCQFGSWDGICIWSNWHTSEKHVDQWDGMEGSELDDAEIGLLLDLDEGTLTAYKDGRRLGVMKNVSYCCFTYACISA